MRAHTPGPWEAVDRLTVRGSYAMGDKNNPGFLIASLPSCAWPLDSQVIAAAPELLEAATVAREALSTLIASGDPVVFADALAKLDAAIAKARGQS